MRLGTEDESEANPEGWHKIALKAYGHCWYHVGIARVS